ncbi:hypothetical protein ACFWAW_41815, partial [Streptomyces sp. NPDC059979]
MTATTDGSAESAGAGSESTSGAPPPGPAGAAAPRIEYGLPGAPAPIAEAGPSVRAAPSAPGRG